MTNPFRYVINTIRDFYTPQLVVIDEVSGGLDNPRLDGYSQGVNTGT